MVTYLPNDMVIMVVEEVSAPPKRYVVRLWMGVFMQGRRL